eukprot:TRINITY_DN2226_c0_g2_i1.p1 TRINITY_DN2226_c0_g2~~TRINITY_DN2226_c0_g2_i1.p1  ORF type:complete len:230 (+),score=42.39 TRINITY_DN2226_c0_g2_i1:272-961(+)
MMTLNAATPGLSLCKNPVKARDLGSLRQVAAGTQLQGMKHCPERIPSGSLRIRASDLAEQFKEMKAAEKRWERQVQEGRVKSMSPKEAGYAVQLSNYTVLDVRPSYERSKATVKNSVWVPMYDVDRALDPGSLLKKFTSYTMGGWWTGDPVTKYNERFMPDVVATIPKSANVIVTCQRGLRSLAACEQMYKVGYRNLFWISGGLEAVEEGVGFPFWLLRLPYRLPELTL